MRRRIQRSFHGNRSDAAGRGAAQLCADRGELDPAAVAVHVDYQAVNDAGTLHQTTSRDGDRGTSSLGTQLEKQLAARDESPAAAGLRVDAGKAPAGKERAGSVQESR